MRTLLLLLLVTFSSTQPALANKGKFFDRVIFVMFENTSYDLALRQPFFKSLAKSGVNFSNFSGITHPSQGNYIALTSGDLNGVSNDTIYDLNVKNIIDLLEESKISWKIYAEDYPGNCFTGKISQSYARRHNPFISYLNIQRNPDRCANIVNANQFQTDISMQQLPEYIFYIPNNRNNGHDTGVAFADHWYQSRFSNLINDSVAMKNSLLITTFDESNQKTPNQIYTSFAGPVVQPGLQINQPLNFYSLLRLVEENWGLDSLGRNDSKAQPVPHVWR